MSWLQYLGLASAHPTEPVDEDLGPVDEPSSSASPAEQTQTHQAGQNSDHAQTDTNSDPRRAAMPPPPLPPAVPSVEEPEEQTTPKAKPSQPNSQPVPSFSLTEDSDRPTPGKLADPSSSSMPPPPTPPPKSQSSSPSSSKPRGPPTLPQFPAANSAQRARGGPLPNRGPPSSSSLSPGLAPPPTHTSKPAKPSRKVLLEPGCSPLDWARLSSGPSADLRNLPPSTPFLRVTPSMLKKQTGRKGTDAWTALNGKVYNITPYAKFHPGGRPELMRSAGRDGTKLFGEIHPWVNYETMLQACLIGLMVDEAEGAHSKMDQMD